MKSEKGQGLVEYALILILVCVAIIAIIAAFWALIALLLLPIVIPWIVGVFVPWFNSLFVIGMILPLLA